MKKFPTGEAATSIEEMMELLSAPPVTVTYDEGQRQMVLLSLARLAADRPGWYEALKEIALKMDNEVDGSPEMFSKLHYIHLHYIHAKPTAEAEPTRPTHIQLVETAMQTGDWRRVDAAEGEDAQ